MNPRVIWIDYPPSKAEIDNIKNVLKAYHKKILKQPVLDCGELFRGTQLYKAIIFGLV